MLRFPKFENARVYHVQTCRCAAATHAMRIATRQQGGKHPACNCVKQAVQPAQFSWVGPVAQQDKAAVS